MTISPPAKQTIVDKLLWRVKHIRKAVQAGTATNWSQVLTQVFRASSLTRTTIPVEIERVAQEGSFGLYRIRDREIWFPLDYDIQFLKDVYQDIFIKSRYESGKCIIRNTGWVIDAGACEGFFSQLALEKGAKVVAIEPLPDIASALQRTLHDHIKKGNAIVVNCALGDEEREIKLNIMRMNAGGSSVNEEFYRQKSIHSESFAKIPVPMKKLDKIIKELTLDNISFIKADVEGSETALLKGAEQIIKKFTPNLAICTYHFPDDWRKILQLIKLFDARYKTIFDGSFKYLYAYLEKQP